MRTLAALTLFLTSTLHAAALVAFPDPWSFQIPKSVIILVTDQDLEALADPDRILNLATSARPESASLRQVCERARAQGQRTLILAFDHFFSQYRPGQEGKPRRLMPDMDGYVSRIAAISRFAQGYGLGLELSLLNPLELGRAYRAKTGESGVWMHYRKGLRDPKTGAFSVSLWQHRRWANNKGPIDIEDAGVRVFAFHETSVSGTAYRAVDPASIVEIKGAIAVETFEDSIAKGGDFRARRIRVHGRIPTAQPNLDRVLVVQQYRTPEMDYFSPHALPFLKELIGKYAAAGVRLNGLYSDEAHIQQDWSYFTHHDHGQLALRYVSPHLVHEFARRYGAQYEDFAKYLVYFAYGQEDFASGLSATAGVMHSFGSTPEAIRQTALFRARYYHLLQDGVVDLFVAAKRFAEEKMGHPLEARAHATWAQSPTIDNWDTGGQKSAPRYYEYTSNFVWSNTVHQSAAACSDYFKWGDFLTGNGNDHAEGGFLDRDYYGLALACSTGILNSVPYSYAAHWGMPAPLSRRRDALVDVYGASASAPFALAEDMQHRDVDVLMLYPLDLVAAEERFGSWMVQYGYANYVTPAKLLERGHLVGGAIEMAGRRFTTLAVTFEPFPSRQLLTFLKNFVSAGGRLVWSGPPPVLTFEGEPALAAWQDLFGVDYRPGAAEGLISPGKTVRFDGPLAGVAPQTILTGFLVDRVYPVTPRPGTVAVATVSRQIAGTTRGTATFLGFRPRDDQSASLGYETRTWFDVLSLLGAYPGAGNTELVSRTSPYLAARFPNGATAIAPHFRDYEEGFPGGFSRDEKQDAAYLQEHPLAPAPLRLRDFEVNGHTVTYEGAYAVAFRVDAQQRLVAFAGRNAHQIALNGRTTVFADRDVEEVAWAPVLAARRVPNGAVVQILARGNAELRIPAPGLTSAAIVYAEGSAPGTQGAKVPSRVEAGTLLLQLTPALSGRPLYVVEPVKP